MNDSIYTGQETEAAVYLCPECGSPAIIEAAGVALLILSKEGVYCRACGWGGERADLLTQKFKHEMGSDEKLVQTMVEDLRNVLAGNFAKSFGGFLMKWGFIGSNVTPKELSQYVVAIAQATMQAILDTRRKIVQERQ
jgi:predicted RNA-binding Zn-ribbon protein involved in translation (DUF1610 family)